jgi:hypothetical protein
MLQITISILWGTGDSVPREPPGLRHRGKPLSDPSLRHEDLREGLRRVRISIFKTLHAVGFVNLNAVG